MDYLFLNRTKKQETKVKLGCLPTSAYRLMPLARHDDFNDAHIKDKNCNIKRASWRIWLGHLSIT